MMGSMMPWNWSSAPIGTCSMHRVVAELLLQLAGDALVVGAGWSILLTKAMRGTLVALHLPVDGDRLGLHAGDRAEHEDRAVEHAQRALHLDGEVDVARGVDDVDVDSPSTSQYVAADWIVMPFSRSRSIESILAPTPSLPRTSWISWIRPV